jgi:hypothetical protein
MKSKEMLVLSLASKDADKITPSLLQKEAAKYGVKYDTAKHSWDNFTQFGKVDLRETSGKYVGRGQSKSHKKLMKKLPKKVNTKLTATVAKYMLLRYFNGEVAVGLMKEYKVTPHQFYNLVRELNVAGTVMGERVLSPTKYAKIDVKCVARLSREPQTEQTLDIFYVAQLKRLRTVLRRWLVK